MADIYNLELIRSGSLSVMAKPVAGECIDDEFSSISNYGINRIVSLLEHSEAYEVGLKDEHIYAKKNKIEFVSYPIPDRGLPESVIEFSKFTKGIYHSAAEGNNIVIHCRAGIGRTGIVAAGVLLHCGYTAEQAFVHISKERRVSVPDTPELGNRKSECYSQHVTRIKTYIHCVHSDAQTARARFMGVNCTGIYEIKL